MGYPMTWKRLINRNGLADGDYGEAPSRWRFFAPTTAWEVSEEYARKSPDPVAKLIDHGKQLERHLKDQAKQDTARFALFAGDLRRLENDTLDEGIICQQIASNLGMEPDLVAAVLKEWLGK